MFNPYAIILGLFVITGVFTTLWGLRVMVSARRSLEWPVVEGTIEESRLSSDEFDLLPSIKFSYQVNQHSYQQSLKFPGDVTPTKEFAQSYVDKYPQGSTVQVFYNPEKPENATLEPGSGRGDWLILAIGLGMVIIGSLLFFIAD